ncbi:hypothetical protein [Sinisalibacter lacisalsi]|uniref:Uncharacterized protein n=1 Tax=Sinisalibacter lacisalsi TaxID=1526570 RepID=A0ABQ1QN20_9RHOB|nr:hypothetical protein [Sinisalibacter lacisalsi]GGD35657.1 hypothetical protein GCM10011358_19350 [Sinisalibacter lacisalsi]
MIRTCLALAFSLGLAALPAMAQDPMTGPEFEAYTTGKTLLYGIGGEVYGGEDYLPGRRVRWSFLDGRCLAGEWYEEAPFICFAYEDGTAPVCWTFFETPDGLVAYLDGDEGQALYETGEAVEPLMCLGPEVGV